MAKQNKTITAATWLYISGIGLVLFLFILIAAGVFSEQLSNISTPIYFFLLIIIGLIGAAFLFGAMRSYAKYNGKTTGGTLELGGPVVLLIIIVYLGYKFKPEEQKAFSITLNIFNAGKDSSEISSGNINLYYGSALIKKQFNEGQVVFPEIPQEYSGSSATVIAGAENFELLKQQITLPSTGAVFNIYLHEKIDSVLLRGSVENKNGKVVDNATVIINDGFAETITNSLGNFAIPLALKDGSEIRIKVYMNNKMVYNSLSVLSSQTSLNIQL